MVIEKINSRLQKRESSLSKMFENCEKRNKILKDTAGHYKERIEKANWLFRKDLVDINPNCIHIIEAHRSVEYGANEKIKSLQDDHGAESTAYLFSVMPIWNHEFSTPKYTETLVDRELKRINDMSSEDNIYGSRYVYA